MPAQHFGGPRLSVPFSCIPQLLEYQAKRIPDAPAILAEGRALLSYGRLYRHIEATGRTLRAMGIDRRDRIAIVLPNGPELPVAILAVAASAVCAPVNPAFGTAELEAYFADLHPRALITQVGIDAPARRAARSCGVPVIDLAPAFSAEAGLFTLSGEQGSAPPNEPADPADTALLLPTSGTTSRPKLVLQRHASICATAYAHRAALALSETDRCLNVMPLFHGHGLHATVIASLAAGASVVCTPGLDVGRFSAWLTAFQPTWYSAVPTMHQAILAQARHARERLAHSRLRFVRSSSASLPSSVFAELERTFESPVIEWYGMTEVTSSPIACNPLPPRKRKAGSVGVPVALDVAVMGEEGALLRDGETGEIVVQGASVTAGYDGNPQATQAAFAGDWLKTGDLGHFDDDGYLFLTGRIREMINRGGEKIAPQEVDEVLLDHPAVAEAVTFAMPHATLGEDVASAIVLRPDAAATPKDIRQFAVGRIAKFKVPRQILIIKEIPKGATGKVQRVGLAAKLGFGTTAALPQTFVAPRTPLETALAEHWAKVLQVERIGIHDDFFALGGDSLRATHVLRHVYEATRIELELARFFEAPTVAEVARRLQRSMPPRRAPQSTSAISPVPHERGAPASVAQERLWELQAVLPGMPFFNILHALRLTPPCDVAVLGRSLNEVVRRHEILRTTFAVIDGRHVQVIAPQLIVPLQFDDLSKLRKSRREMVGHELVHEELLHSFDLMKGPLIRSRVMRMGQREDLLLISMHQVICDGWSLGVLINELATLYDAFAAGRASPLQPLAIQYADFAYWQRHWRSYPKVVAQLSYWREQLRGPLPAMRLARSGPRRTLDELRTARREVALPAKLSEAVKRFSQREGVTLFMTLMAAFKTLLHRYTEEDDLRVATHVANRNRPRTEELIGPLVNMVILRTNLRGDPSFREVIRRVRATTLAAFSNQDIPFEEVVETLERERAVKPVALAQVMMWLQNETLRPIVRCGQGLSFKEAAPNMLLPLAMMTTFDIVLMLRESTPGLIGMCVYKPHLFASGKIAHMLRDLQRVLEYVVMRPEGRISAIPLSQSNKAKSARLVCS
jgi:acyl-CoA synthetase (AMP-forming)/AMP-acid ligase II